MSTGNGGPFRKLDVPPSHLSLLAWLAFVSPSSLQASEYLDVSLQDPSIEDTCFTAPAYGTHTAYETRLHDCHSIILEKDALLRTGDLSRREIISLAWAYHGLRMFYVEESVESEAREASQREVALWEQLLESEPHHPGMLMRLAHAHLDPEKKAAVFRELIAIEPNHFNAWFWLASAVGDQEHGGSEEEARAVLLEAYERWPLDDPGKLQFADAVVQGYQGTDRSAWVAAFTRRVQADHGALRALDELEAMWRQGAEKDQIMAFATMQVPPICERGARLGDVELCRRGLAIIEEVRGVHPDDLGINQFLFVQYSAIPFYCRSDTEGCEAERRLQRLADTLVRLEPNSARRRLDQAKTRLHGDRMSMLQALVSQFEHAPSEAYWVLGRCLWENGYVDDAIVVLRQGLASATDGEYEHDLQHTLEEALVSPPPATPRRQDALSCRPELITVH